MKKLKALSWKLYPYYSKVIAAISYLILKIIQNKNKIIILLHQYLGTQLYALSCLKCIKKEYSEKQVTVIAPDNNGRIINTYREIDKLIVLPFEGIKCLAMQCLIRNNKYSERGLQCGIINTTPITYIRFRDNIDENAREILVKYIYQFV